MLRFLKILSVVTMAVFALSSLATANVFVVDDDGDPLTTYSSLASAIATAESFVIPGPHDIVIMPGFYSDAGLSFSVPGKIGTIAGDPGSDVADIVFTDPGTNMFMDLSGTTALVIEHFTVVGYATGFGGNGLDVTIQDIVFDGNASAMWLQNVDNSLFDANEIMNGTTGIRLYSFGGDPSDNNIVSNNNIHDLAGMGVAIGDFGVSHAGNAVADNDLVNCALDGILFRNGTSGSVTGNNSTAGGSYGLAVEVSTGVSASDNCFYGHPGVQASDDAANSWADNYYGDIAAGATTYALDNGAAIDASPKMRTNTPVGSTSMEVWSSQVVDFMWALPDVCDPADEFNFAAYEFEVTWDPTKLEYVGGENSEFFGPDGLYILTTDDAATGSITFSGVDIANPNLGEGSLGWAEFNAIGVGAAPITVASIYRDDANNDIPVMSGTLSLTVVDTEAPAITVTANNPIGDDTYSDGFGNVQLFIEGTVTDNYDLSSVWYRFNDAGGWIMIQSVTGTSDTYGGLPTDYYLDITGLAEGAHDVNVIVVDASGNRDSVYYSFDIDRTGPAATVLVLADSDGCATAGFSSSDLIDASWTDDGSAVEHEFYYPFNGGWQGVVAYENGTQFTLDGTEGVHQLWVRLFDAYGNMGTQTGPTAITVDKTDPVPSAGWLVTNPTPAVTNQTSIVGDFNMDVAGGTVEFMTSEDMGAVVCGAAEWASAPPTVRPFAIELSAGDGTKTVYFGSRDAAGNVGTTSATIELDQTAPEFGSFSVVDANGDECSDNWIVNVIVEYDADADVVFLSGTTGSFSPSWGLDGTSPDTISFNISTFGVPVCDDFNVVFGVLEDLAGNQGAEASDDILVDCSAPSIASVLATDTDYDGVSLTPHINWSNDAGVLLEITGLAVDVVEVLVSETGAFASEEVAYAVPTPAPDPFFVTHTYSAPTGCTVDMVYVMAMDCAGRVSVSAVSDGITFDFDDPTINSFAVSSADPTNVLSATLAIDVVDVCLAWKMNVYENGYEGDGTGWVNTTTSATIPLADDGDGVRTIVLETQDPAGNMVTTTTTVEVDQTYPSGAFAVQQFGNPLAMAGFTNSLSDIEIVSITGDADVVEMAIRNDDGSGNTGWLTLASSYSPFALLAGGDGTRTVQMIFKDDAGNFLPWAEAIEVSIEFLGTVPAAPTSFVGVPGGSTLLSWDAMPNAQSYYVKFNRTSEYPLYTSGLPPAPADSLQGLPAYFGPDNFYDFVGPAADIYSFSAWTIDMAGNMSTSPSTTVATNYILGDINLDGELTIVEDFGAFSTTYLLGTGDPGFLPECDFGPTDDNTGTGLPLLPLGGFIDLEDLIIMGMNYINYSKISNDWDIPQGNGKIVSKIGIIATVEGEIIPNEEFVVSLSATNAESILAYYLSLEYDAADLELVSIVPGEIHKNITSDFFYTSTSETALNITGMALSNQFEGNVMAKLTFRSKSGEFRIESNELVLRDVYNNDITASFETVAKEVLPTSFALNQNYPNPFNPTTKIEFLLPKETNFVLSIYNITGQRIHAFEGHANAGLVAIEWDANRYSSGVYFYKLEAGTFTDTKKMVLLK